MESPGEAKSHPLEAWRKACNFLSLLASPAVSTDNRAETEYGPGRTGPTGRNCLVHSITQSASGDPTRQNPSLYTCIAAETTAITLYGYTMDSKEKVVQTPPCKLQESTSSPETHTTSINGAEQYGYTFATHRNAQHLLQGPPFWERK